MKLVRQVTLECQQGTSDNVCEVELCASGAGKFLVNFRSGGRGQVLQDETKTPVSVSEAEAVQLFDQLVAAREQQGYRRSGPSGGAAAPQHSTTAVESDSERLTAHEQAVLQRLAAGHSANHRWSLSRAAWRCGELQLFQAESLLIGLLGSGNAMLDYCLVWALAQCGSSACVDSLRRVESSHAESAVRRIAAAALLEILEGGDYEAAVGNCIAQLPASLQTPAARGPAAEFAAELDRVLAQSERPPGRELELLYLIDNDHVRPALLDLLRKADVEAGQFEHLRRVFKIAEMRRDGEVFGIIVRLFEKSRPRFRTPGRCQELESRLSAPEEFSDEAFSHQTRNYLRRRAWRTLQRVADLGQADDYVNLAAGILLEFSDEDAEPIRQALRHDRDDQTGRVEDRRVHFDRFSKYYAFHQILYANSRRYRCDSSALVFRCVPPFEPGSDIPPEREEAYPELWDQHSNAVLGLLLRSRCEPVHLFAVKVLSAAREFCRSISVDALARLLRSPCRTTVRFAADQAISRDNPKAPDRTLVQALADCADPEARAQAFEWIDAAPAGLLDDASFAVELITCSQAETRRFARDRLHRISLPESVSQVIIGRLLAILLHLDTDPDTDPGAVAGDVAETLLLVFGAELQDVSEQVIRDVLAHPLPEVQRLAGELILGHRTLSRFPPHDMLESLLESDHESVRGVGVRIIGQLPDAILQDNIELLTGLIRHHLPDIRSAIRPTVVRLSTADPGFAAQLAQRLIDVLLIPGAADGVPTQTARVLREDLHNHLADVSAETMSKLLRSQSAPAQDIGGLLLTTSVRSQDLSVQDIVQLADHETFSVREAAWNMCSDQVSSIKTVAEAVAIMADSRWPDTRQFALKYLREHLSDDDGCPPEVLIRICDSARPEVQQLGRSLITQLQEQEPGAEYLVRLSEHPSEKMQLFAFRLLEQQAVGDWARLQQFAPYIISVLFRGDRSRVAKSRTLQLLRQEAVRDERAARVAAEILGRVSATAAMSVRAAAVEIMLEIHRVWPAVDVPLLVRPPEVRSGLDTEID